VPLWSCASLPNHTKPMYCPASSPFICFFLTFTQNYSQERELLFYIVLPFLCVDDANLCSR
jgi:hypothetical protein